MAYKSLLCAAVDLNRFAAQKIFGDSLRKIDFTGRALLIGNMLKEEMARYSRIYEQVDKAELNLGLHLAWDLADKARHG